MAERIAIESYAETFDKLVHPDPGSSKSGASFATDLRTLQAAGRR